jgi:hypothetical protein
LLAENLVLASLLLAADVGLLLLPANGSKERFEMGEEVIISDPEIPV